MPGGVLIFGFMIGLSVFTLFIALWRLTDVRDPVEERMRQYGVAAELLPAAQGESAGQRPRGLGVSQLIRKSGFAARLAVSLMRAGIPLTAAEFMLIVLGIALAAFFAVGLTVGFFFGLLAAGLVVFLASIYLRSREAGRRRTITWQLPDALTLLIGALRAGHGLPQALELLVQNMRPPASEEFALVTRAIALGASVDQALWEMADRVGSDDMTLVVTAINVQIETGGNLAQTLETIAETVRERIRLFRQIRVLTAQQRLSGLILSLLPILMAVYMLLVAPDYIGRLFEPGWVRIMPIGAVVLQLAGFFIMNRIMNIEV